MDGAKLRQVCRSQLRVGSLGFGGPLATMSFMRDELVDRHGLITNERYIEGLAVVKLLPGPVSTLLAVFLGQQICGAWGGLLSGICYVAPSFFMLLAIVILEHRLPPGITQARGFELTMQGVQVAVLSVVLYTCWKLFIEAAHRVYAGRRRQATVTCLALLAAILATMRVPEIVVLLTCAALGGAWLKWSRRDGRVLSVDPVTLFATFFVAGLTVFGTGYMVLPHLQRVLVEERHWITVKTFLDSVAWGNLTPGPIVIASTYMGYDIGGLRGALAATVGIFAGPILLMLLLGPLLRRVLGRPWVEGVLLGLIPAVAATITVGLWALGRAVSWDPWNRAIFGLTCVLAFRRLSIPKVFGLAALMGWLHSLGG